MAKFASLSVFDKVALELGRVNMSWSRIEDLLEVIIATLLQYEERNNLIQCITANVDVRSKVQIVKSMAFILKQDELWFDTLVQYLDTIDNDLRVRRNALVHAHWYKPGRKLIRQNRRTKLKRPQAFQMELTTFEETHVKVSDVKKLNSDMISTWGNLLSCLWYIQHDVEPPPPLPSPGISFQQYLQGARQVMRERRASRKQPPPRKSSPRQSV